MDDLFGNADAGLWPLLQRTFDGVLLAAPNPWRLVYANPAAANWLGTTPELLHHQPVVNLFDAGSQQAVMEQVESEWKGDSNGGTLTALFRLDCEKPDPIQLRFCRIVIDDMPLVGIIIRGISDHLGPDASKAGRLDPLTGLADRDFLFSRLVILLRGARHGDHQFGVLFVDLDNFKDVNDRHGHLIGDVVLREAARRLSNCVRDGDHIVRFGGDEFVVLVERAAGPAEMQPIIQRIAAAIAKPIAVPGGEVTLSLSVGLAMALPEYQSPDELLAAADRAMYASKRASG